MTDPPRKRGRPTDAEKSALVKVRTTPKEKATWQAAAAAARQPLSAWIRDRANKVP